MLLKKEGFPQDEDLVLCTVTNIQYHSVFVQLDEYGKTGLIHISEISPGRIRNIRDFVTEGKKVVCKVLQVNKEKGHIDLSLRRVNEAQKREKLNQIKKEQLAEKIIENVAKARGESILAIYKKVNDAISQKFLSLFDAFEKVSTGELDLSSILDKKIAKEITDVVKARIHPPEVKIKGDFSLSTYSDEGIELIRQLLAKVEENGAVVKYKGAGTYHLELTAKDYKSGEKTLKKITDFMKTFAEKNKMIAQFVRQEE